MAGLMLFLTAASTAQSACLNYDPSKVTLTGILTITRMPPPREYEGDIHLPILKVDQAFCVHGRPNAGHDARGENNIRALQLVFADYPFGARWNGKRVTVTGKLFHGFGPAHYTNVLLMVTSTREAET